MIYLIIYGLAGDFELRASETISEIVFGIAEFLPTVGQVLDARHLQQVEVNIAEDVRGGTGGGLKALEETLIALAVALSVVGHVGDVVPLRIAADLHRA